MKDLAIIIPTYNEEKKIQYDILSAVNFLLDNNLKGEIIIVNDGSEDDTKIIAEKTSPTSKVAFSVISYKNNRGKGYAVRTGILAAKAEYIMFADAGSCVDYKYALIGMDLIKNNFCDIAHASRNLKDTLIVQDRSFFRKVLSQLFRFFVHSMFSLPPQLTDTQCGFKIYRGHIAHAIYSECVIDGMPFDIEVILRAFKKGCRIKEFPIKWHSDPDSRVLPAKMSWRVFSELIQIKRNLENA